MDHVYKIGQVYRDRAGIKFEDDEFLRWLHHERTIANAGGVRWRDFLHLNLIDSHTTRKIPAYFVLVTVRKRSQYQNPWEDVVSAREIRYWGDAKIDSSKTSYLEFRGNQRLAAAANASARGKDAIPPVLHFTKYEDGWVQFNGLCWLSHVNIEHFDEGGRQIENLVLSLTLLDVAEVPIKWLKERSLSINLAQANRSAPSLWLDACDGVFSNEPARPITPYALAVSERAVQSRKGSQFTSVFDPDNLQDGRSRILIQIFQRQGQFLFRQRLLEAYGACCAVTGCKVIEILEACHIRPYRGHHTNDPRNGILLRSDIHTLFDQGLLGVEPNSMKVAISQALQGTEYESYHGASLKRPSDPSLWPDATALMQHYAEMNTLFGGDIPHSGSPSKPLY